VGEAEKPDALTRKFRDALHPSLQWMAPFDAQHAGQDVLLLRRIQLGATSHHPGASGGVGAEGVQPLNLKLSPRPGAPQCREGPSVPRGEGRKAAHQRKALRDDGEGLKAYPRLAQADKVHVSGALADTEVSVPEQTVGMSIRDVRGAMEGDGVHGGEWGG